MQIFLRTLRGNLLTLEAAPSEAVADVLATTEVCMILRLYTTLVEVKERLVRLFALEQEAHGAPADLQRLVWGGRTLAGDHCLSDYGVTQDCTLELVLGLK